MRKTSAMVLGCVLGGAVGAQVTDEVLVVAQRTDIAERDATAALLRATTLPLRGRFGVRELCAVLGQATGGKATFAWTGRTGKASDLEPVDFDLPRVTPLQVLALLREHQGIQAAWRAGLVCLAPEDEVKELTWLALFDVRAELMPLRDFPGPELGLPAAGQERVVEPEREPHTTVAGFDGTQLAQLVREHAARGTWDGPDVSVEVHNGVLLVRQTERGHREVRALLHSLGIVAAPRSAADGAAAEQTEASRDAPRARARPGAPGASGASAPGVHRERDPE